MNDSRCRGGGVGISVGRIVAVTAGTALMVLATVGARAQQPAAIPSADAAAAGGENDLALSLRYRFSEKYGVAEDPNQPDLIVQYQVGAIETKRIEIEKPTGAPDRQEFKYRTLYTERPTKVGRLSEVVDAVRRYDSFRVAASRPDPGNNAGLLKDMSVWYHLRPGSVPEFICTAKDRSIRQLEYDTMVEQTLFPRLMAVMPPAIRPVRIEDTWPISHHGALALLGRLPEEGDIQLEGRLADVRKVGQGTAHEAIVEITGEIESKQGIVALDARVTFVFEPPPAAPTQAEAPAGENQVRKAGIVEARGYVAKLQMGRRTSVPIDQNGRLHQISTRELILARRMLPVSGGGSVAPLNLPATPPTADQVNSWILYDDPSGRYNLRHPQEFQANLYPDGQLLLIRELARDNPDLIFVDALGKNDPRKTNPQAFVKSLHDDSAARGLETVGHGQSGWLPEKDWAPRNRRVFHFEEAYKNPKSNARLYIDDYVVLTGRAEAFSFLGWTRRDDHVVFRNDLEKILLTFDPGPSGAGAASQRQGAAATVPSTATATRPSASSPAGSQPGAAPGAATPRSPRRIGPPPSPE